MTDTPQDSASRGALERRPLAELRLSAGNPRRTEPPIAEIAALAESIATIGLQQNLIGHPAADADTVLITGGGLRLRALTRLADAGMLDPATPIPVMIHATPEAALEAAIAENEARRAMTPADQYRAYAALRATGHGTAHIAAAMATDEAQVARVLALDRASPLVLTALGAGRLTLDQARAFTADPDAASQDALLEGWDRLAGPERDPAAIRQRLRIDGGCMRARRKLDDIGRETYTGAGGTLTEDLFSNVEIVDNRDLVDRLFRLHVDQLLAAARAEGWSWAEFSEGESLGPDDRELLPIVWRPSAEEDAFLDHMLDLEDQRGTPNAEDAARRADLRAKSAAEHWSEDQKSVAGVIYSWSVWRGITRRAGILRAADLARARELGLLDADASDADASDAGPDAPDEDRLSEALRSELRSLRAVATANALSATSELALDVLAWLTTRPSYPAISGIHGAIGHVHGSAGLGLPRAFDLVERPAHRDAAASVTLTEFQSLGKRHRDDLLARWIAQSLDAVAGTGDDPFRQIEAAANVRLRAAWTPGEGFLGRLTMAQLDALYRHLTGDTRGIAGRLPATVRKADAVNVLAGIFADPIAAEATLRHSGHVPAPGMVARVASWLPAPLRQTGGTGR